MKERPILFKGRLVRRILADAKTQTRRILNESTLRVTLPKEVRGDWPFSAASASAGVHRATLNAGGAVTVHLDKRPAHIHGDSLGVKPGEFHFRCPYADGETVLVNHGNHKNEWTVIPLSSRLWVKETWGLHAFGDETDWERGSVVSLSKGDLEGRYKIARRADWGPLQESCFWRPSIFMPRCLSRITLEVEKVRLQRLQEITPEDAIAEGIDPAGCNYTELVRTFAALWRSVNGPESWDLNPWVWSITFRRLEQP